MRDMKKLLILGFFLLGGCSQTSSQWNSEAPYAPDRVPEMGDILHTRTGHYISRPDLYTALSYYPLVYVGEQHDNPAAHRLQLEILKAMQERHPGEVALGMEMFNHEQQAVLDRWVSGELGEKEFLRESQWFENWGMDIALYRDLLEFCRAQQIPVIGLNVPGPLGRKVSMTPLDQLDAETRAQLPEMDMSDPYQRIMVENVFAAHQGGEAMMESFARRQTLWDESMAERIAAYMQNHPGRHMVVAAGDWHVQYGFGIPRRVHRRLSLPYTLVGGYNLEVPEEKRAQYMDVDIPGFPMRPVDYLVYQAYEAFNRAGVSLGVALTGGEEQIGVNVNAVLPGSVAEKAGIRKGDRILRFDGAEVKNSFDLVYAVKNVPPGDSVSIEIKRGYETLRVDAHFTNPAAD